MTQLRAAGLSKEAEAKLKRGEAITNLIIQDKNRPVSLEEQILYLYALNQGLLDNLSPGQIKKFKQEFFTFVQQRAPSLLSQVRGSKELPQKAKDELSNYLKDYFHAAGFPDQA